MPKVFHLLYISHAAEDISHTDIRNILDTSRKYNASVNITGVLILRDDYFLQVLEGPKKEIQDLVFRIRKDDRNHGLRVLIESESEDRLFKEWSMAFLDGDLSHNNTTELVEFFDACVQSNSQNKSLILPMVKKFRSSIPDFK